MSKLVSLNEAIQSYVHDGDTIYAAGFTHRFRRASAPADLASSSSGTPT